MIKTRLLSTDQKNERMIQDFRASCAQNCATLDRIANTTPFDQEFFLAMAEADLAKLRATLDMENRLIQMDLFKKSRDLDKQAMHAIQMQLL